MRGLFDAKVHIYRITDSESRESTVDIGEVNTVPTLVEEYRKCTFQMSYSQSRDEGAGARDGGWMTCFIDKHADVQDQDILKIVSGPEQSSVYWQVFGKFTPSRARWHRELRVKPYIGELPE